MISPTCAAIGLRDAIVHDHMNIDMRKVNDLLIRGDYRLIGGFLARRIEQPFS